MPLPEADAFEALLGPTSAGERRGPLLPPERYADVPKLQVLQSPEQTCSLPRVVALRIDPCFVRVDLGAQCGRQPAAQ